MPPTRTGDEAKLDKLIDAEADLAEEYDGALKKALGSANPTQATKDAYKEAGKKLADARLARKKLEVEMGLRTNVIGMGAGVAVTDEED